MQQHLIATISAKFKLTDEAIALCSACMEPVSYPKNTIVEEEGKVPQFLYYMISGFMRLFHFNDNGEEVTTHINCPAGFITSYSNFANNTVSTENVALA